MRIFILDIPFIIHAILDKLSNLSKFQFPYLQNRNNNNMVYLLLGLMYIT